MNRPLVLFSIALIIGIVTGKAGKSYIYAALTVLLIFIAAIIILKVFPKFRFIFIGIAIFYLAGAFEYLYFDSAIKGGFQEFAGKEVIIRGSINNEPEAVNSNVKCIVGTSGIIQSGKSRKVSGKILLTTPFAAPGQSLEYGMKIEISGIIEIPKGRRNPGGFDYRQYLAGKGVSAIIYAPGYCITTGSDIMPDISDTFGIPGMSGIFSISDILMRAGLAVRKSIVRVINASLPAQQAGLLNGMLIGYTEELSDDIRASFSDAGLSHIMAVSGANVAFIVFPLLFLLKKARLGRKPANLVVIGILILFVFITGFEPSVMRAVIMAVIMLTGQIIKRETDIYTSISLAAIILLLYNPFTLFNIGFQLSFAATLSLVLFHKNIRNFIKPGFMPETFSDVLAATLAAQAGVLPVTVLYFNKISLVSILSNLIVVPLVELITILGSLMAVFGHVSIWLSQMIGCVNYVLLSFVLFVTKTAANMPFAVIRAATPSIFSIILYYMFICFFLGYKPKVKLKVDFKYYVAILGVIILIICLKTIIPRDLTVVFIDVGEGDSALIMTPNGKTVLIDGGGRKNAADTGTSTGKSTGVYTGKSTGAYTGRNIGDTTIIPLLLYYGIAKLDLVIATHGHSDHIEGLIPVLKCFRVYNLVMPDYIRQDEFNKLTGISKEKKIAVNLCKKGDIIRVESGIYFNILNPPGKYFENNSYINNSSLVLKLNYSNASILFAGDIEKEVEDSLVSSGADIRADVLKVAHHGSDTSTGQAFLDDVSPGVAVVSVGKNNFGHPSPDVIKRLIAHKTLLYRTDEKGAVILRTGGQRITIETMVR